MKGTLSTTELQQTVDALNDINQDGEVVLCFMPYTHVFFEKRGEYNNAGLIITKDITLQGPETGYAYMGVADSEAHHVDLIYMHSNTLKIKNLLLYSFAKWSSAITLYGESKVDLVENSMVLPTWLCVKGY